MWLTNSDTQGGGAGGKPARRASDPDASASGKPEKKDAAARWRSLKRDGILKIEGACAPATASLLREYVVAGVDKARRAVDAASDPPMSP